MRLKLFHHFKRAISEPQKADFGSSPNFAQPSLDGWMDGWMDAWMHGQIGRRQGRKEGKRGRKADRRKEKREVEKGKGREGKL